MQNARQRIAANLRSVRERMAEAARRAGRHAEEIRLVAITKYVAPPMAAALVAEGCHDLGESRPQELWHKAETLADSAVCWHMIGHLQRNKVRRTVPHLGWLQSGDSLRLLTAVDEVAREAANPLSVLLEVNVSGDASKQGLAPAELPALLPELARLSGIRVRGLMAMAALVGGRDVARRNFASLRELRDHLRPDCPGEVTLDELSMGMSGDFEEAIEEGATMVRVGSALFEGIEP